MWRKDTYAFPIFYRVSVGVWGWITTFILSYHYLSMLILKLIHFSKKGPCYELFTNIFNECFNGTRTIDVSSTGDVAFKAMEKNDWPPTTSNENILFSYLYTWIIIWFNLLQPHCYVGTLQYWFPSTVFLGFHRECPMYGFAALCFVVVLHWGPLRIIFIYFSWVSRVVPIALGQSQYQEGNSGGYG